MGSIIKMTENQEIEIEFIEEDNEIEEVCCKELTTYTQIIDKKPAKYYIGYEITNLLGYKNSTVIARKVSPYNKVLFKDFQGVKEPNIDYRIILINKEGIKELVNTAKKNISNDTLEILGLLEKKSEIVPKQPISYSLKDEDNNELTMYSYISNYLCFEYFIGYEIVTLLGYKNTTQVILNNVSKCNQLEFRNYPGVKIPELDPRTILITRDGAIEILIKTRKRISPDVLHILKKFHIDTTNKKCLTKEQQTLSAIANAFKTEKIEDQFSVDYYYLDMYFPDQKIVVECDENNHSDRKPGDERMRMDIINETLNIDDSNWIRYNPDEKDFDISKVIGKIYIKINESKEKQMKELQEEKQQIIEKIEKGEIKLEPIKEIIPKIEIQPTTCKFTAPPKEFLLKQLETKNISDIAKMYCISTNPVSKWLKQYEINIKDFKKEIPTKEALIEHFKDKNQIEVAEVYDVSAHVVRTWLKKYEIDVKKLKSEAKTISKDELLSLVGDYSKEEITQKLRINMFVLEKLLKTHNIDKIPSKQELKNQIESNTKEDIAKYYNTTRTTLRKWIESYNLGTVRYCSTNRPIMAGKEGESAKTYNSIAEICKELHISHSKVYEFADTGNSYNGYYFSFVKT